MSTLSGGPLTLEFHSAERRCTTACLKFGRTAPTAADTVRRRVPIQRTTACAWNVNKVWKKMRLRYTKGIRTLSSTTCSISHRSCKSLSLPTTTSATNCTVLDADMFAHFILTRRHSWSLSRRTLFGHHSKARYLMNMQYLLVLCDNTVAPLIDYMTILLLSLSSPKESPY
jgi:hypothetical protein